MDVSRQLLLRLIFRDRGGLSADAWTHCYRMPLPSLNLYQITFHPYYSIGNLLSIILYSLFDFIYCSGFNLFWSYLICRFYYPLFSVQIGSKKYSYFCASVRWVYTAFCGFPFRGSKGFTELLVWSRVCLGGLIAFIWFSVLQLCFSKGEHIVSYSLWLYSYYMRIIDSLPFSARVSDNGSVFTTSHHLKVT